MSNIFKFYINKFDIETNENKLSELYIFIKTKF